MNHSVAFFDEQFQRQSRENCRALNPFETLALPYLCGDVLDLGCGLGNLSLAAARGGCRVTALDASPAAIGHLAGAASAEALPIDARLADLALWTADAAYDSVAAIGLFMFFPKAAAARLLDELRASVHPGGCAAVNVLIEGTTYLDMFTPGHYTLFTPQELRGHFADWEVPEWRLDVFGAPGGTRKEFATIVARRPRE